MNRDMEEMSCLTAAELPAPELPAPAELPDFGGSPASVEAVPPPVRQLQQVYSGS